MWIGILGLVFILTGLLLALKRKREASNNTYSHKKTDTDTNKDKLQNLSENTSQNQSRKVSEQIATQSKGKKSKGKKQTDPSLDITDKQFVGSLKVPGITAIDIKQSKLLIATLNNQLQYYDLKQFKKQNPSGSKKGYQLLNNRGTSVFIGNKYLYVTLDGDRTVHIYEFVGQNGVYFKLVNKFPERIHSSEILSVYADEKQQFVLTTGSQADTTIKVFNLKGQKIHETNTSQVQHYAVKVVEDILCLKSWAPSYKLFRINSDKKSGSFTNLQKSLQLSHQDGIIDGSIDPLGNNAITIRKNKSICVWKLDFNLKSSTKKKQINHQLLSQCTLSQIHTIQTSDGRLKTIIGLSGGRSIYLTDLDLNIKHTFNLPEREKDDIGIIKLIGKKSLIVCGVTKESGRVYMWNGGEIVNTIEKYQH